MKLSAEIALIARKYFSYMARNYPVMCLSDEFYFFPRATDAIKYLDSLDCLDEQKIKENLSYVKKLKSKLEDSIKTSKNIEDKIDSSLLLESMSTFLREFERVKIWQVDPTLYLRIFLLGVDTLLSKLSHTAMRKVGLRKNLLSRMKQLPRLIGEAKVNLKEVPGLYIKTGIEMVNSTIDYLRNFDASPLIKNTKSNKELLSIVRNAVGELCSFKVFLSEKGASGTALKGRQELEDILNNSFSYNRSLEEIFDIARLEYDNTIKELEHAAGKIGSRKKWQNILSEYCLDAKNKKELLNYYAEQIDRLKTFFTEKDLVTIPKSQTILARETPPFLIPVRASASYSCPVTNDMKEPAFFYVTAKYAKFDKPTDRRAKSIHNEYIFISAHETYIGHHLLDTHRRQLKNPIRRQVESALFYEGWASYAEWFIASLGYIKGPLQRMVGLKRRAWRAIRAMLDAGVRINKISLEDAKRMLSDLGYEPDIVKSMVDHYILTPGYQLCYTVGKFEIEQLKNRFSHTMGLKKFHDALLESGEAPFDLIKERMDKLICKDSF